MRFIKFEIKNFKGISHAIVDLSPMGQNIFTLIGLNESGKTTVLEAIAAFSIIKEDTSALYTLSAAKTDPRDYVPKNLKSNFTGDIEITAWVEFEKDEKLVVVQDVEKETGGKIIPESIPDILKITRGFQFENSDFKRNLYSVWFHPKGKEKGKRKEGTINWGSSLWKALYAKIESCIPQIIYYPTFLFSQPDKIFLNPEDQEKSVNKMYRQVVDNIAASLSNPLDVKNHIVDRIIGDETSIEKMMAKLLLGSDKNQQIQAALNDMSAHVTDTVFDSWEKIFGGSFSDRQIQLNVGVDTDDTASTIPRVYLQFSIKDGKSNYNISERSLGFRWFFHFLLFTHYRVSEKKRKVFFLLDEPASNLHAKAQVQLLESLPKVASGGNQIMYSTHSHYLVEPAWLDQAFIISNKAIDYDSVDESRRFDKTTAIDVVKYRTFVGANPDKMTYFQPVLDKLDVLPSKIDLVKPSVLVEGKSDFLIIEYGRRILLNSKSHVSIVPTRGATGMDELIGLFMGWAIPFMVCLDDDNAGRKARTKYMDDWAIDESQVITLADIDDNLTKGDISKFLDEADLKIISEHFQISSAPTKSQIQLFFSEHLAQKKKVKMSDNFLNRVKAFEEKINSFFNNQTFKKKTS